MKFLLAFAAGMTSLFAANISLAETLAAPTGEVILTISGNITQTNVGDTAQFDRAMLEGMGATTVTTSSPWYDTEVTFEGVSFKAVMDLVGAHGTTIHAFALNDYDTEIPFADTQDPAVVLAMKMNGIYMEVRDKGPIFVVYPYDSDPVYQTQTYYARSAWQVSRMTIE